MKNKQIYKKALKLAVPMMIQNGITNAVSLVDNVMVGSLGTEAMTAVSIVGQLIFVFNLAIFGALSGPGIYGAQFFGQNNIEGLKNTFRIKHLICAVCLAAGLAVFIFGGDTLVGMYLKGESGDINARLTMDYARQYMNIMLWGLPPFVITQIYAVSLRETGDSFKPMIAGVSSVFADIILNWLLIYGKLGFPELGVKGAAIATVTARAVEMGVVVIWSLARKNQLVFLKGAYKTFAVPKALAGKIIKKTIPIFFNEFLWAGAIAVLTQTYAVRGLTIVAGLNISNAICNLLNVVFVALGNAVGILIGHTLGASNYDKAKKDAFHLMWFTGTVSIILTVILISLSGVFPKFYATTQEVRNLGRNFIIITALFFPVQGFLNAMYFTLRAGGKTFVTFLFDSIYSWAVAFPIALILCKLTDFPILAIYAAVQAVDIIKLVIGYIMIKKGVWISNLVE